MTSIERCATVSATPDTVWAVLADFAAISTWAPNVDHSCLISDQTEGPGTTRRIQAGRATVLETVERWEVGESLSYAISGLPAVIRSITTTWSLVAGSGGTDVALRTYVDAGPRPPQRGIAKIVGRKLGQASDDMLAGLALYIEETSA